LIVDDESIAFEFVKIVLDQTQIESDYVENGLAGLEYYKIHHASIDAILMDCNMPVMDGYVATEKIRKHEQENNIRPIFIAAVTADNYVQNKIACLKAGMNCFISKPVTKMKVERILDMLREYIPS
jgi:CheY-like chemotaxis protein